MSQKIETKEQAKAFVDQYDHFLFDCDGVLWLDTVTIPGVNKFIDYLSDKGKTMAFVTNNSSKSRDTYVQKFHDLKFRDVKKECIYPTSYSAGLVLKEQVGLESGSKVWVFGDEGIEQELRECGFVPVGGTDAAYNTEWDPESSLLDVDDDVKAVVVGSTKAVNYMRIASTVQYLLAKDKGLPFVGTNIDRTYPGPKGRILPAGGSLVFFMKYTCDREFIDVGKPSTRFLDAILESQNFKRERTVMVGDTMYTDIKFGNDGNLGGPNGGTLLVLSGGSKAKDLENIKDSSLEPSYYIESLGHLIALLS